MTIMSRRNCITRTPTRDDGGGNEHLLPQAVVTLHEIFHVFQRQCTVVDRARSGKTTLCQRVAASQKCFQSFFFREREAICLSMIDKSKQFHFHVNESYFMHYIQYNTLLTYLLCHHDPGKIQCEHSSL